MFLEGVYSLISGASQLQALLGTPAIRKDKTTGIFPEVMPKGTPMPAIVYTQIFGEGLLTMDGPDSFTKARVQFSCYAKTPAGSKRLAATLRQLLEAYRGTLSEGTQVFSMRTVLEIDSFEDAPSICHTPIDMEIFYSATGS